MKIAKKNKMNERKRERVNKQNHQDLSHDFIQIPKHENTKITNITIADLGGSFLSYIPKEVFIQIFELLNIKAITKLALISKKMKLILDLLSQIHFDIIIKLCFESRDIVHLTHLNLAFPFKISHRMRELNLFCNPVNYYQEFMNYTLDLIINNNIDQMSNAISSNAYLFNFNFNQVFAKNFCTVINKKIPDYNFIEKLKIFCNMELDLTENFEDNHDHTHTYHETISINFWLIIAVYLLGTRKMMLCVIRELKKLKDIVKYDSVITILHTDYYDDYIEVDYNVWKDIECSYDEEFNYGYIMEYINILERESKFNLMPLIEKYIKN